MPSKSLLSQLIFHAIKCIWTQWRRLRGLPLKEKTLNESDSMITTTRPNGKILWFHVPTLGTASISLPFIQKCLLVDEVYVLLTSSSVDVIRAVRLDGLNPRVSAFHFTFDSKQNVEQFIDHWQPQIAFFLETCDLSLAGVQQLHRSGCLLVLFKARFMCDDFAKSYACTTRRLLCHHILSHFSIILPETQSDAGRYRMMGASLDQMPGWCSELIDAAEMGDIAWAHENLNQEHIRTVCERIAQRPVWMALSIHEVEVPKIAYVYKKLKTTFPQLLMFLTPLPANDSAIALLRYSGLIAEFWTPQTESYDGVDVFVIDPSRPQDTLLLCNIAEIAFVGYSLFEGMKGSSVAQACIASCAVVTGKYADDFSRLTDDINHSAIVAAEEAEAVVYNSAVAHHSDDFEEDDQERVPRPTNGMLHQLSSRPPSSVFSLVTDNLMSSLSNPTNAERPRTAPPTMSHVFRSNSLREAPVRENRNQTDSPPWTTRPQTANDVDASYLAQEDVEQRTSTRTSPNESPFRLSNSFRQRNRSVFQINEESYDSESSGLYREVTVDVDEIYVSSGEDMRDDEVLASVVDDHRSSLSMDSVPTPPPEESDEIQYLASEQSAQLDSSKSCSAQNTDRGNGHEDRDLKFVSPNGEYVMPATHLPFDRTGPAIWTVKNEEELTEALHELLTDRLQRRSRGQAASQGAARYAIGSALGVWNVVFDHVVDDALSNL